MQLASGIINHVKCTIEGHSSKLKIGLDSLLTKNGIGVWGSLFKSATQRTPMLLTAPITGFTFPRTGTGEEGCKSNDALWGCCHDDLGHGCRCKSTEQMVADLKRDPHTPS